MSGVYPQTRGKNNMLIRCCSIAYGEKYLNYYNNFHIPSIKKDIEKLKSVGHTVEVEMYGNPVEFLTEEIPKQSYTFFSPPDIIWAKDSLYNLSIMIDKLDCCISVPHFRVNDSFRCDFPIESDLLFSRALLCAHKTFTDSFDNLEYNGCHWGISTRKISDNLYTMRHNMPHVTMIKFRNYDLNWFIELEKRWPNKVITQWDREWMEKLTIENRLKIAGSSELAFGVELTDPNMSNPVQINSYNDRHCDGKISNDLCRSTIYTMKGKE